MSFEIFHGLSTFIGLVLLYFLSKRPSAQKKQLSRGTITVKPIFMMSPLSVSTYLPPNSIEFDLVIFDEASQVKPVDAFSPLLRGKQAVVVGDSKHLPPTSFFDTEFESSR